MMDSLQGVLCVLLLAVAEFKHGSANSTVRCIESEKQALLRFKKDLYDPGNKLASWTSGEEDCCRWSRVGCDPETGHVTMLDIGYNKTYPYDWENPFAGILGPSLLELPYLSHLNFGSSQFKSIPKFIGSLHNLTYLNLDGFAVSGEFPYQLGNLSKLQCLYLSGDVRAESIEWLSGLSSLRNLTFNGVEFAQDVDWLRAIKTHPSLAVLDINYCHFPGINSSSLSFVKPSKSLAVLYLVRNTFNSSIFSWLFNISTVLVDLTVADDQLEGSIPNSFNHLIWLEKLDLAFSNFKNEIPTSFQNLCHLKTLDLSYTNLSEPVGSILQRLSCSKKTLQVLLLRGNQLKDLNAGSFGCESLKELDLSENIFYGSLPGTFLDNFPKLVVLDVNSNQFEGQLPDFEKLSSLRELHLQNNSFNGSLGRSIAMLSDLNSLDVSSNFLYGTLSETHLSTLSKLQYLDLSGNSLSFNVSAKWIPPFQLNTIKLRSCKLGPSFPSWLKAEKNFSHLDISNSEISETIPSWFWNLSSKLQYLNISFNNIKGQVPNLPLKFYVDPAFDLRSNQFYGSIPQFLVNTTVLNLSRNKFSGTLSFLCTTTNSPLTYLDLSDNLFSGGLTDCWVYLQDLRILNVESNNLSGMIPASMGLLYLIETLQMRNNNLTGTLPPSLANCINLNVVDLGDNNFSGDLPAWIGESLTRLIVLRLRSNKFLGSIPSTLCQLGHLQLLDLSFNNLEGAIPTCLNNFTAMASDQVSDRSINNLYVLTYVYRRKSDSVINGADYINYALIVWKGVEQEYRGTLGLLKLIDLSNNYLDGNIPDEVMDLSGLISLNLSRNNLSGSIPDKIGQLKELDALDLSHNALSGKIPSSLADISRLSVLDLSRNKLSGRIPKSTQLQSFGPSAYLGNPELCGCPLPIKCAGDNNECLDNRKKKEEATIPGMNKDSAKEDEELLDMSSLYGGMGVGFAVGFSGFCSLLLINTSWRRTYFLFLNKMGNFLYLIIVLNLARRG